MNLVGRSAHLNARARAPKGGQQSVLGRVTRTGSTTQHNKKKIRPRTAPMRGRDTHPAVGSVLQLWIRSNWGDPSCVGLTGLEVLSQEFETLHIDPEMITCNPAHKINWNV
jgi:hypothetical protein